MIRIALVDDHEVVRQGLYSFLSGIAEFDIVAEGATGKSALDIVAEHKPDVLLLDMILPDVSGLDVLLELKNQNLSTNIIILSSFSDAKMAVPAVQAGARGYLLKDIPPKELIQAITDVHNGQLKLHPDIAALLVEALNEPQLDDDVLKRHGITQREKDVLCLIGKGYTNKQISDALHISQLTVKTHVSHILDKLQLSDRTQVAIFAIHNELVD
jgi:DNA-binding NarL/FixJ family response regulator